SVRQDALGLHAACAAHRAALQPPEASLAPLQMKALPWLVALVGVVQADALCCPLADGSVDAVYCSFGLKTLDAGQTEALAREVCRVLRPGGRLAFLEISVPRAGWLRWPYMLYLKRLIPVIGALLLGNPDNYRLLGVYTERFGDCGSAASAFERAGLALTRHRFFAGCATGFSGRKAGG
ncbi:MAG: class I SAM-dependent methyltransferase, partial [Planctomycetota bacterium]